MRITQKKTSKISTLFFAYATCSLVILLSIITPAYCIDNIDKLRVKAVIEARDGNTQLAIEHLERLYLSTPQDIPLRSDLIILYSWNEEYQKAINLYQQYQADTYPEYIHTASIANYRHLGETSKALTAIAYLLEKTPNNPSYLLKKAQLQVDNNLPDKARQTIDQLLSSGKDSADLRKVLAYLNANQNNWIGSLQDYQYILDNSPNDREGVRGTVQSLVQLGAPYAATTFTTPSKNLFDNKELANILVVKGALLLRWSSYSSKNKEESFLYASQALLLQIQALALLQKIENTASQERNIQQDMVVSLKNLESFQASTSLFEQLHDMAKVPPYVSHAAATSYLGLKKPKQAITLLQDILQVEPDNYNAKQTLFYSYIEDEDYNAAYALVDQEIQQQPQFLQFKGSTEQYSHNRYLDVVVLSTQARLYGDQLKKAWESAESLSNEAPANDWLMQVAGEAALARGWPRKAYNKYHTASLLNPENNDTLEGMAQSLLQQNQYTYAGEILSNLKENHPIENSTLRLEKDIHWLNRPDLWADFELSYSNGPEQSGDGVTASTELISSPINENVRLHALARYAWSEIPEGEETYSKFGAGIEYGNRATEITATMNMNKSTIDEMGGVLRGIWAPDDYWHFSLAGEYFSDATPLRALYHSIRQDRINGSIQYRWSESRVASVIVNSGWFTDDNYRFEAGASFSERIIDIPHFDVDAIVDAYGSTNSERETAYYNPEADFSLKGILRADHTLYKHYETKVGQKIETGFGSYTQRNFDTGMTGHLRYELSYSFSPRIEALIGGEAGKNRYDGENEPYYKINFLIHAKL